MNTSAQELGQKGERLAEKFLKKQGFKVVTRNFKTPRWGEIDLIMVDWDTLVFVEVKTRKGQQRTSPAEAIGPHKLHVLKRAAYFYKAQHPKAPDALRLDVVTVEFIDKKPSIKHYRNVPV